MAPQLAQTSKRIALAVFVTQHRKDERRRERAAQQIGYVAQQLQPVRFD